MVADTVWVALASGGAAVAASGVTAYINRQNTKDRLQVENERRRAEYFLKPKVEALTNLYKEMYNCRHLYQRMADKRSMGLDQTDMNQIDIAYMDFQEALDAASPYLSDDQLETVEEFRSQLVGANTYFLAINENTESGHIPTDVPDHDEEQWDRWEFFEAHEEARDAVKAELAEPIEQFESLNQNLA